MLVIQTSIESARAAFVKELEDWQDQLELDIDYNPDELRFAVFLDDGEIMNVIPIIEERGKEYWILIPWRFNKKYVYVQDIEGIVRAAEFKVVGADLLPTFRADLVVESTMDLTYI